MPELDPCVRARDFREVELGFTDEQAIAEAQRCLECGCASVYTCELKRLATQYDANVESYKGDLVKNMPDKRHPFIALDMNKCVLCGRCVRICSNEIVGANALGFVARGYETKLKPALDRPLLETTCESCGMCAATCPTGAIEAKPFTPKPGPWELTYTTTTCTFCSVGCKLKLGKIGDTIVEVSVPEDGFACFKGRFATRFIADTDRILAPYVNGKKTTLKAATETLVESLAQYRKDRIAVLVSPRLTCEEMNAAVHFAETLGTKLIGSATQFFSSKEDRSIFSSATLSDVDNAKNIILVQGDIAKTHPTASYHIVNAIHRGASLYVIGGEQNKLTRMAKEFIPAAQGENTVVINALTSRNTTTTIRKSLLQSIEELSSKLESMKDFVVVHATQLTKYETPGDTVATHELAEKLGAKLLVLPFANNSFGLEKVIGNGEALCEAVQNDGVDAIIAFGSSCYGEIPNLDKLPVLCILETFATSLVHRAQIVLPLAAFTETDGTFINAEMREMQVHAVSAAPLGINNFTLIKKLIKKLGGTFDEKIRCDWKIKFLGASHAAPTLPITPTVSSLSHNYDDSLEGYVFDLKLRSGIRN